MVTLILLILATMAVALFLFGVIKGGEFNQLVENLDDSTYPLKDLYVVGFFLNSIPLFSLRGNLERDLKAQSRLYWDNIYSDYYALLTWAQFLTFALLILSFGLAVASIFSGGAALVILGIVALAIMAAWNMTISSMKEAVDKRREECEYEFPTMVSKLALLVNTGMILRQAWYVVAYGKEGELYSLMRRTCDEIDNGASEIEAIHKFGVLADSNEVKKFTSAIIQGLERGGAELAGYLMGQTSEMWAHKRQLALQRGEVAAGKLIIPLGLMFGGIILIIVVAAMQSLSF